jgi:AbiTii
MAENKKIKSDEIINLLEKIKEGATGNTTPISELLRLCLRLAKQLNNEKLASWALSELNGYKSKNEIPDYRVLGARVLGHFFGPFGSSLKNASIPSYIVEKEHIDFLFNSKLTDPVAELENLASGDSSQPLESHWPADIVAYYQRKQIYKGVTLADAWRSLSKPSLRGVLDTIRTRILEFALNIEDELGIKKGDMKTEVEVDSSTTDKVTQIFNSTINGGNVSMGNLGPTDQRSVMIHPGDLSGLKHFLKEQGVTDELLVELDQALEKDSESVSQPGPATSSWLSRVMFMIHRGGLSVASNSAGSLIASAIMQYLGM